MSIRSGDKLDFLGYTFQYFNKTEPKYRLFHDNQGKQAIACYPQRNKYKGIVDRLKKAFEANYNSTAYALIAEINPIIRG